MEQNNFIQYCRFYHGEDTCPESIENLPSGGLLWFYEKKWVEFCAGGDDFQVDIGEYNAYGMADFSTDDGVPLSLKALLFNRFYKDGYMEMGGRRFRLWYNSHYLRLP